MSCPQVEIITSQKVILGQIEALIGSAWKEDLHSSPPCFHSPHGVFFCPAAKLVYSFRPPELKIYRGGHFAAGPSRVRRPSSDSPIFGSKNRHEITVISRAAAVASCLRLRRRPRSGQKEPLARERLAICGFFSSYCRLSEDAFNIILCAVFISVLVSRY